MGTTDATLLFGAGLLAGAMNAAAGGGSFVTLPALVAVGVPSVEANASSTVALFPASLASALAYRDDFAPLGDLPVRTSDQPDKVLTIHEQEPGQPEHALAGEARRTKVAHHPDLHDEVALAEGAPPRP